MFVFIDESGNHNLNYSHTDDPYDIFVLGAVCIHTKEYELFDARFRQLKKDMFGDETFILHTKEITRPTKTKDKRNLAFSNAAFRKQFYARMGDLIDTTDFEIVTCIIKKKGLQAQTGANVTDPYIYSLNVLLDQVLSRCVDRTCSIYPEKRDHTENMKIELEFLRAKNVGTMQFTGAEVSEKVEEFVLKDKKCNMSGLQLIDLIVSPIGRHFLGKKKKEEGHELSYRVIQKKIRSGDLIVYP